MPDFTALVRARLAPLDVDPAREADIVAELAQHVAEHYGELIASGVDGDTAMEMALAPLGDRQHVAADIARADRPRVGAPEPPADGSSLAVDFWRDLRYAARLLMRAPGFAAIAIVTLALGIGANAAIFSVLSSVLLRPLPYADPARLVMIGEREADGTASNVGYTTFLDWRDRSRGFEEMALIRSWQPTLTSSGEPERISAMRVSWNFFHMLGVQPALGRDFRADEDTPDRWRVLLISDRLWRRRFVMLLLECFGAVALLMTAVGLYGVIAYTVSERTREIGIRAALGASRRAIVRLVVGSGFAVVSAGLTAGVLVAAAATKYLQGSLYGISPTDPVTFAAVIGVLVLVTLAAQGIPIARAMRVDPAVALRQEQVPTIV